MGIVNVTPDSFSDGGPLPRPRALAIAHGKRDREQEGADLARRRRGVDATRSPHRSRREEELERVVSRAPWPRADALDRRSGSRSTPRRAEVARDGPRQPAPSLVNDVSAGRRGSGHGARSWPSAACDYVADAPPRVHARGRCRSDPELRRSGGRGRVRFLEGARPRLFEGRNRSVLESFIDPGIGFGKRLGPQPGAPAPSGRNCGALGIARCLLGVSRKVLHWAPDEAPKKQKDFRENLGAPRPSRRTASAARQLRCRCRRCREGPRSCACTTCGSWPRPIASRPGHHQRETAPRRLTHVPIELSYDPSRRSSILALGIYILLSLPAHDARQRASCVASGSRCSSASPCCGSWLEQPPPRSSSSTSSRGWLGFVFVILAIIFQPELRRGIASAR